MRFTKKQGKMHKIAKKLTTMIMSRRVLCDLQFLGAAKKSIVRLTAPQPLFRGALSHWLFAWPQIKGSPGAVAPVMPITATLAPQLLLRRKLFQP